MDAIVGVKKYFIYFIFICFLVLLALRILIVFSGSTDLAGIEQNVIYSVQVLSDSGNLYLSPENPPFSITQYTPFFYYLCALTYKIAGHTKGNDIQLLYLIGRSLSLVFNFITAILVFVAAKNIFRLNKNQSLLLFLISFALTFPYNFAVRPDSMCDMLGLLSILCFLFYLKNSDNPDGKPANAWLVAAVLISAFALFTKQSGIQLIFIYGGYFLLNRKFKSLLHTIILTIVIYGFFLLLFSKLYPSFFQNVIGGVANGINLKNFFKYVIGKKIFLITAWPIILASFYILLKGNCIFKGKPIERFLALCLLGTFTFATLTGLKMGSGVNYYVLFLNIAILFIAFHIGSNSAPAFSTRLIKLTNQKYVLYGFITFIFLTYTVYNYKTATNTITEKQRLAAIKVCDFISKDRDKSKPKYIFANLTTDTFIPARQSINNVFYRTCLVPQMDILEYSTGPSKIVGYKNLEALFYQDKVEYIVESDPKLNFTMLDNLENIKKSKYKLVNNIEGYLIYKLL